MIHNTWWELKGEDGAAYSLISLFIFVVGPWILLISVQTEFKSLQTLSFCLELLLIPSYRVSSSGFIYILCYLQLGKTTISQSWRLMQSMFGDHFLICLLWQTKPISPFSSFSFVMFSVHRGVFNIEKSLWSCNLQCCWQELNDKCIFLKSIFPKIRDSLGIDLSVDSCMTMRQIQTDIMSFLGV